MDSFTLVEEFSIVKTLLWWLHQNFDCPIIPKTVKIFDTSSKSIAFVSIFMGLIFSIKVSIEMVILVEEDATKNKFINFSFSVLIV